MNRRIVEFLLKGSAIVFIFKLLGAVAFFILSLLISHYAGPAVLGRFNLLSKMVLLLSVFASLGLDTYVVRKMPEIGVDKQGTLLFLRNSFGIITITSLFLLLMLVGSRHTIDRAFFKGNGMSLFIVGAGVSVWFYSLYSFICQFFRGMGSVTAYAFFRYAGIHVTAALFLLLALALTGTIPEPWVYSSYYLTIFIGACGLVYYLKFYLERHQFSSKAPTFSLLRNDLKAAQPMMWSSSLAFVMSYLDIFVIGYLIGEYAVGIYSAIQQFMLIFTYISISIASYSAPLLAERYIRGDRVGLRALYLNSILAGAFMLFPIFVILAGFPKLVLGVTFGPAYVEHAHLMTILSVGFFINALTGPAVTTMNMTDNQAKLLFFSIANVALGIVLTFALTYFYSLTGAAIASSVVTASFKLVLFFYITTKIVRLPSSGDSLHM